MVMLDAPIGSSLFINKYSHHARLLAHIGSVYCFLGSGIHRYVRPSLPPRCWTVSSAPTPPPPQPTLLHTLFRGSVCTGPFLIQICFQHKFAQAVDVCLWGRWCINSYVVGPRHDGRILHIGTGRLCIVAASSSGKITENNT